ncbi:hypothetical protein HEQ69_09675 [Haematospirillum jordaniae]|uniref:contractile injection system protein, VgrG/Pvc8 family n=1 Tax=Haematospirillum jordaniae TaxID=1549855 RepID=UPI001432A270|nr:contractile injection system protein, VgrG/Pvc8 family [Haematospirillum jordaniae]NKD45976.1 hypothetical protein [Haematospirillum jordaniae]
MIPDWRILAENRDITTAFARRLLALRLLDKSGMEADQLELSVFDDGSIALPARGVRLSLAIGWKGESLFDKGRFVVDEIGHEGPPDVIRITARSADFQGALKDQREASYEATNIGSVLGSIAERHGLAAAIHPDLAAIAIDHIDQTNESDLNFISRLGEDHDALSTIKAGRLLFLPAASGVTASGAAMPSLTINRRDSDRHSFRTSDREGSTTGIAAKWHNLSTGSTETVIAGREGGSVKTLKKIYTSRKDAEDAAAAAWKQRQRGANELTLSLALGKPDLCAGMPLNLVGWSPEICRMNWIADDVTHTIDGSGGFTTDISACEKV